jgi:enamine deaminase RidA (YjgF/YER057c/UK114 family)
VSTLIAGIMHTQLNLVVLCPFPGLPLSPHCSWVAKDSDPTHLSVGDQTLALLEAVGLELERKGCGWKDVTLVYLYLSDMGHYPAVNEMYTKCFAAEPPAR